MENREQQILSEIKTMMASIRVQLEKLDAKMAELQQVVDPEDVAAAPIDLDINESELAEMEPQVVEQEIDMAEDEDLPSAEPEPAPAPEPAPDPEPAPEPEPALEPEHEQKIEEEPVAVDDDDDLPLFGEPATIFEAAQNSPKSKKAVIDVMTDKQAWRTDRPGAPVRDLLSAISLNDRVQFINVLFNQDPVLFQQTRAKINIMESLDQVEAYITSHFDWDMSSQVVYRFMMAVRRKVQQ